MTRFLVGASEDGEQADKDIEDVWRGVISNSSVNVSKRKETIALLGNVLRKSDRE
jgi:hypothetical protein